MQHSAIILHLQLKQTFLFLGKKILFHSIDLLICFIGKLKFYIGEEEIVYVLRFNKFRREEFCQVSFRTEMFFDVICT